MDYDLTIIGAGWAGFNASLRAKELGLKVCLIDESQIGGTCLNKGCIPTKALIQSAKVYSIVKKSPSYGIDRADPALNFIRIQQRKEEIIQQLRSGMQFMLKEIDFLNSEAKFVSNQELIAGGKTIKSSSIIIACGSKAMELKSIKFDGKKILSSDDILNLKEIPKSLLIIGGGVIGCEFASLFTMLGSHVSIVEMMPHILPGVDKEVASKLETVYKKRGLKISTNTDATTVDLTKFDTVLVCIGRSPDTQRLNLQDMGINLDKNKIIVDEYLKTSVPNIYAAGDCTGKIMLAHFAAYQGVVAAENIAWPDNLKKADNAVVPNCIFTDPEIAAVGLTEDESSAKGLEISVQKFNFLGSGMARIMDESEGFIKIISDKKTGYILGASIIGPKATELIASLTVAITNRLTISQIKNTIFAHPTLSESILEAL